MKAIVVYPHTKQWVEIFELFKILRFMGISIKDQEGFGDKVHDCRGDYLIIEGEIAWWANKEEFTHLIRQEHLTVLHFDALCFNIKSVKEI